MGYLPPSISGSGFSMTTRRKISRDCSRLTLGEFTKRLHRDSVDELPIAFPRNPNAMPYKTPYEASYKTIVAILRKAGPKHHAHFTRFLERAMGIEPTSEAWEASILPLYDDRSFC